MFPYSKRGPKAFTLIELLIVVGIIAILALIAVPNLLEAQVRSKVSRCRADLRTLATAVESYAADHNRYPYVTQSPGYAIPAGPNAAIQAAGLTTPIAYITSIFPDPFGNNRQDPNDLYGFLDITRGYWYANHDYYDEKNYPWYVTSGSPIGPLAKWVLMSMGPDQRWANASGAGTDEVDEPLKWQYDPTNGTVSDGNVVRTGP